MEKATENELAIQSDVREQETAEDPRQGLVADVWRWLKVRASFDFPKATHTPPLNRGHWQQRV